jgi:hypothetical protein
MWRHPQPVASIRGEAAVRVVAANRSGRRTPRAGLRADGRVRGRDRASTLGAVRARAARRRSSSRSCVRAAGIRERTAKHTKTRLSNRAVPLQAIALAALDSLPPSVNPDPVSELARWSPRFPQLRSAPLETGPDSRRHRAAPHLYDLRHTYATFALRAGVSVFAVSRFMGSSTAMIDYHYGHLTRDSREHAVSLLDALAIERAVDAGVDVARSAARNPAHKQGFVAPPNPDPASPWTFGGRRNAKPSPTQPTEGADQQELREAL